MLNYTMIDSDSALLALIDTWNQQGIKSVAMDFEGEFNLHIYGEHLCLIQLYDDKTYYLVDPFQISKAVLKQFLEDASFEKVMFDCASDSALVRKQYGIILKNVHDIRVSALALGYTGNLTGLIDRYIGVEETLVGMNKKKSQMTNWLIRPLKREQIQYALSDVQHLLALKDLLFSEVKKQGLAQRVEQDMLQVGKSKGPDKPGWTKFSSWKYLSKEEKVFLKHFFIARDSLARKYNVPAVRIMEKHLLLQMAKNLPATEADFHVYCSKISTRTCNELLKLLANAKEEAVTELKQV
ncbi:MAG: 3'-5' exonuclease [Spirochaetia bacterium]|nr:3'-5' exonuclease [Spirochaetia bacterium]